MTMTHQGTDPKNSGTGRNCEHSMNESTDQLRLYVAAAPSIWKLTDTNDDGVAARRKSKLLSESNWYQR